jgi:hypothetical protein
MTADEWEASDDALEMLKAVRGKWRDQAALQQALQRYYLACCRAVWPLLPHPRTRRGVEAAERYLDGLASAEDLDRADRDAQWAAHDVESGVYPDIDAARAQAAEALSSGRLRLAPPVDDGSGAPRRHPLNEAAWFAAHAVGYRHDKYMKVRERWYARFHSARLLRCVFANPFRRPTMLPAWRTGDVVGLARGIDEDRAYDRMPLLGDALMDAGADEQLLVHARADGHVRGCWLVDLVLSKE